MSTERESDATVQTDTDGQLSSKPAALEELRTTLQALANDLLDSFYREASSATAYGTGYEAQNEADSRWYIGREHGSEGAEDESGIDFFYRKFRSLEDTGAGRRRQSEEYEYVYGDYGWMDAGDLLAERPRLRQLFESAVESEFLEETALETFADAYDRAERAVQEWRQQFSLPEIKTLFREHEADTLLELLGHGDEESRVVWSLLFSKDEHDDVCENPIAVPLVSEDNALMLVRAERTYVEGGEVNEYPYVAVIGYDDTPETFFVHRLESDPDIRDPETEWTVELVKEKMGFDHHLWEVDSEQLPSGEIVRVQGDLAIVRHDFQAARDDYQNALYEQERESIAQDFGQGFLDEHPHYAEDERLCVQSYATSTSIRVNERAVSGTPALKSLQAELDIDEETVRERMKDDWQQLTAKRRRTLINEILNERLVSWAIAQSETTEADIAADARTQAKTAFSETDQQVNAVHGNHTLILGPATEHPDRQWGGQDTLGGYIVPPETAATGFVIHDEHEDKQLALGEGVYEVRFLAGYEDQWWM